MEITATNSIILMLRIPDAKESVMKCCSTMVIGG
jgi:hypothetical protein